MCVCVCVCVSILSDTGNQLYTTVNDSSSANVFFLFQVVCERGDVLASGCAVSRAFPLYSSKTPPTNHHTVTIGFLVVGGGASSITDDDIKCLTAESEGGRSLI